MPVAEIYRVRLDNDWSLNDLYDFPHALSQTYSFAYCFDTDLPSRDVERIDRALQGYPWGGGYSYVNLYTVLQNQVPPEYRPRVKSIQYASPGWLDLWVNVEAIQSVATSVALIATGTPTSVKVIAALPLAAKSVSATLKGFDTALKTGESIIGTVIRIQKLLQQNRERKKKAETSLIKADTEQVVALEKLCRQLSKLIAFKGFDGLLRRAGNEEIAAKILIAQFKRLSDIADYAKTGRAILSDDNSK